MCLLCSTPFLLGRSHFRERVVPDKSDSVVPMDGGLFVSSRTDGVLMKQVCAPRVLLQARR